MGSCNNPQNSNDLGYAQNNSNSKLQSQTNSQKQPKLTSKTIEQNVHTPETKQALDKYFKGAKHGDTIVNMACEALYQIGFTPENTLFAQSTCPDEVNHDNPAEDITTMLSQKWGEVFPLGGLAGLPFTGKTGWGAFSAHVPEDGNIAVLFAPHVGIDN